MRIGAVLALVRGVASGTLAVGGRDGVIDVATAAASRNLSSQNTCKCEIDGVLMSSRPILINLNLQDNLT